MNKDDLINGTYKKKSGSAALGEFTQSQKVRKALWAWWRRASNAKKTLLSAEDFYRAETDKFIDWINQQER